MEQINKLTTNFESLFRFNKFSDDEDFIKVSHNLT